MPTEWRVLQIITDIQSVAGTEWKYQTLLQTVRNYFQGPIQQPQSHFQKQQQTKCNRIIKSLLENERSRSSIKDHLRHHTTNQSIPKRHWTMQFMPDGESYRLTTGP